MRHEKFVVGFICCLGLLALPSVSVGQKATGEQNKQGKITALSWESSETLPAKGRSIEKLIYIAKRAPLFGPK